jgi:hypothetical protein
LGRLSLARGIGFHGSRIDTRVARA